MVRHKLMQLSGKEKKHLKKRCMVKMVIIKNSSFAGQGFAQNAVD